ncbi:hypothetical protein FIBSPDRAFT_1040859 [Athelia psychrophila]|uniref:Sister chromatid cohesion protein n=1 Tax=Athelia psychrophila TaxID=1759441 RepID=A0A166PPP2_9AGAM|nr:hypothetical protein FIBSPDRAFT_1040859 [Fibularhizoctonia sp. CBS 109695]
MDSNNWYNPPGYDARRPSRGPPQVPTQRAAANSSVQNAHRLLASYPMASATPSNHIARHLGPLPTNSPMPSYIQPQYYAPNGSAYPHGNYPQHSEYAREVDYLSSPQTAANDSGYWETTRNDAIEYLGAYDAQSHTSYGYANHWTPPISNHSAYQTNAFAQSVFHRTAPSSSYPTPPPPGFSTSSSSLAFALGTPAPPPSTSSSSSATSAGSAQFFNHFIGEQNLEIASQRPASPPRPVPQQAQDSPDPLALRVSTSKATASSALTPRKRKQGAHAETPSLKRVQSSSFVTPNQTLSPKTPTSAQTSTSTSTISKSSRKMLAFVEVPPLPKEWKTPNRSVTSLSKKLQGKMKVEDTPEDLGGYGSVDEDSFSPPQYDSSPTKSSARRTGDRDERAPLEKLTALLDDIFEAEDSLSGDANVQDLPAEWFSSITLDGTAPQLSPAIIRKLSKYIGQVARPTKRFRLSARENAATGTTPRGKGRVADLDTVILSRILKILERSVKAGDDLDPFHYTAPPNEKNASPRKPKKPKRPKAHEDDEELAEETGEVEMPVDEPPRTPVQDITEGEDDRLSKVLQAAKESVLAADCCVALLASDRLTKQLYSEELITTCLSTIKNQLNQIVYPFVEATSDMGTAASPLLRHLHKTSSSQSIQDHRRQLSEIFQALTSVVPRINNLIYAEAIVMSDAIVIQTVYIAIGPFFVVESGTDNDTKGKKQSVVFNTLGSSAMRGLRLDAMSLIRNIFANREDQRSWIIEEILSSLIKLSDSNKKAGQFRLRDGRTIRTVSALLLQLVQTSAHDVRLQATKITRNRQKVFALRRQESSQDVTAEPFLDENDTEEIRLYTSGLESAQKAAKTIVLFLTQRSGRNKATKNSNEAEYRAIFDNLIADLLSVLFWPEWPAASLLLSIVCKFMVSSLDDVKTSQVENNAAKTMALDHLGIIAARMRSTTLKFKSGTAEGVLTPESASLRPLDEILSSLNIEALEKLLSTHQDVTSHLCKRSSEDQAFDSARELTAATWGRELAAALKDMDIRIQDPEEQALGSKADIQKSFTFGLKIKHTLRNIWTDPSSDIFDVGTQEDVVRIDRFSEEIGSIQALKSSFQPILNVILQALDAPPVFMRTKALRALGQIVTSDPTILSAPNVRRAIEAHLLDNSPAVRDAAVELIGKYMIDSPKVAGDYYQKIADRIADTGLGVRKRVIKLLKSFYGVTDDVVRRVDICTKLVFRMLDEDDTVKELAVKTLEELWFQSTAMPASAMKGRSAITHNPDDKSPLLAKVAVIMGVSLNFKDRQSPLEDVLHKIMVDKDTDSTKLRASYAEVCETLIDGLVDASDLPGFTVINCVRTIHLFTSAYPAFLSGPNASTLLLYLKNATTPEEQATSDYLLKIFRACIPHMPKTAAKFGLELQQALQPMILKPPQAGGILALQETVATMCAVVQHLTHAYERLVTLAKSCNARLQQALARPAAQQMTAIEARTLSILIFIVSLLAEHCDFDRLRLENTALAPDLDTISKGSIVEHIYLSLLKLYNKYGDPGMRGRILQCLGFLFRAQPSLMTLDQSATIMDAIFASPDEESRGRLLKIMQEFLVSEAAKHSAKEKESAKGKSKAAGVNMEELVGNTDGFADSGVSSAIVQRYLTPILDAALSQRPQIQAVAIDVLSFTIKQGLAHPLQSFPVIVALETSENANTSARANALHAVLHSKHTSLLNTRYVVSARASFDYQIKIRGKGGKVQGYRMQQSIPTALLQRWYSLVREKRAPRQDFLKALVKVFDVNNALKSEQDDVDFSRYMAENFAAFDFKTQEEVFTVIKYLTSVLSTAGMQLVELLSPANLLNQLRDAPTDANAMDVVDEGTSAVLAASPQAPDVSVIRSSVIIAMTMLLKAHLKALYGLSEEKCTKFVTGKKSAVGDKPAVKRQEKPISWARLHFATVPILTREDMEAQTTRFLEVWNEDGLTAEPEEDFA